MGRANKALASRVQAIAGGFLPDESGAFAQKTVATGNPVRPAVLAAAGLPYQPSRGDDPFRLVVFGGSQGAQFFSRAVPAALALLPEPDRRRLHLTLQARPEDREHVDAALAALGMTADVAPFFGDMAERLGAAHLVLCRSGASTVSEMAVIGCPAILVPYPYALDHDQAANAAALVKVGGGEVVAQAELSPERLSAMILSALREPDRLSRMAEAARGVGRPNAAALLADLVAAIADKKTVSTFKGVAP
jgi:UDP-N-acetylglucosamine--N-acetylmuramyl-(pentapeptide) pyrophosphoryl-undecaprenol N-acetylglucosamine transferase